VLSLEVLLSAARPPLYSQRSIGFASPPHGGVAFVEEQLLRPALLEGDAFAGVRIDRMVEDHVNEHRAMRLKLASSETAVLRDVIDTLRAHLDAEERYLLTAKVLRDDVVQIHHDD